MQTIGAGGIFSLAGCAGGESGEGDEDLGEDQGDAVFVDALDSDPGTLDIHEYNRVPESMCLSPVHERLFTIGPDLEPEPYLATDFEANEDETEHVIAFEEGVEFHDGSELTAEVARWNFERCLENAPNAWQFGSLETIEETDDYELTFQFENPHPFFTYYLANVHMGFASQEAVEEAGDTYGQDSVVGSGPLVFEEWSRDQEIIYSRNEDYDRGPDFIRNQGPVNFEEYHIRIVPESTTLLNEVTVGSVDGTMWVSPSDTTDVEEHEAANIERIEDAHPIYFAINVMEAPTDEPEVRQAIAQAIDKEGAIEAALHGEAYPIWSLCPPTAVGGMSEEDAQAAGWDYDPDAARDLLDAAGWENGSEGEVRMRDGEELDIAFFAFDMEPYSSMGEVAQNMLNQIGINANLEILESGTLYDRAEGSEHNLMAMSLSGGYVAQNTLESTLHSVNYAPDGGSNYSLYQNEEYDSLLEQAGTEPDEATRDEHLYDAQEMILDEVPVVPVAGYGKFYSYKDDINAEGWLEHDWWPSTDLYNLKVLDVDRT